MHCLSGWVLQGLEGHMSILPATIHDEHRSETMAASFPPARLVLQLLQSDPSHMCS